MTPGDRTDASTGGSLLARLRAAPLTLLVAVITLILTLVQVGWSYENISATRRLAAEHEQHLRLAREVGRLSNALLQAERAARAAAEQPSPAALARLREANDLLAGRAADVRRDTPPGWQERAQQVSELALVKGRGLAAGATAGAVVPSLLDDFLALAEAAERGAYEAGVTAAAAVDANRTRGYGIVRTAGAFALAMLSLLLLSAYLDARRHQRDLRAAHARAEALALTDPLTGLGNRRAFDADLDAALERAAREGEPLTLLAIDMDGLKLVNDREGHARGDRLLSAFGTALAGRLLAGDRVYR
ncbi:MAG TPA: GGDEF domain-containing protein, partial [Deinococcales bacterium]|nr:GGDEF domain-containing protein [Deinococcales bacterium]